MKIRHELNKHERMWRDSLTRRAELYSYLARIAESRGDQESASGHIEALLRYELELEELMNQRPNTVDVLRHVGRKAIGLFKH